MATSNQSLRKGVVRGIHWTGHCGFWDLLLILQPVLAFATAKMWPHWQYRLGIGSACILAGTLAGWMLQTMWSREAGSSDAWSKDNAPNATGIIHILHMGPEIGIMLMLLISGVIFREMPWPMFFGALAIVVSHLLLGNHWPLRIFQPAWSPKNLAKPMTKAEAILYVSLWVGLVVVGVLLLARSA